MNEYISIGVITSAHGIRGRVKIKSFSANPSDIESYSKLFNIDGSKEFGIIYISSSKNLILAEIRGLLNRDDAEQIVGTKLFVRRSDLPQTQKDEFYIADLIGIKVLYKKEIKGEIIAVHNFGAGDIIEIRFADNKTLMYSFSKENFSDLNSEDGTIEINII